MGLSNYQLVLLDNLIYLDETVKAISKQDTIRDIINTLLYANGDPSAPSGTGTIRQDCINSDTGSNVCMMNEEEWIEVLKAIEADSTLCALQIHNVKDDMSTGFRAATFIGADENVIIFRGTSTAMEWVDNGEGGYMSGGTDNQLQALNYVNCLDIANNNRFVVSGHSKGGNLAQYVTLFAEDTIIDKCLSFDGQGFSEEMVNTEKYKDKLRRNSEKLYMISSNHDYVNVLSNRAA